MSLFSALHDIARAANITILISAEGDDMLRVNVTPIQSSNAEKKLWPLSIAATPAELDAQFADAVAAYQPSALSVLDQARACAAANSPGKSAPAALPAPDNSAVPTEKRGRGRPPKNKQASDGAPATSASTDTDSRQMSITDDVTPGRRDAGSIHEDRPDIETTRDDAAADDADDADDAVDMY
jgi:PRTRC genetic system protein E